MGQVQREHYLREQMRIIQKELGEDENDEIEVREGPYAGTRGERPDIEPIINLGSKCGLDDPEAVTELLDDVESRMLSIRDAAEKEGDILPIKKDALKPSPSGMATNCRI